jgi:crotonobetainyl-CoA:carnitine CoA-transferase CaiB-like acyl-CoA transferase
MTGPLAGIRIVDLSAVISGPLATMLLADQGAEVIKVEPRAGDITRYGGFAHGGISAFFANANRGKRSLAVDLDQPAGREIVLRLVARADVFVQNFRPGAVERMGLGESELRKLRPDLIYVSISGFGESGPYASQRVYDPIIQGLTGNIAVQRHHRSGERDLVRNIVCDKSSAYTAAQAITAALFARERGAGGQHVRVAMLDASLAFFWPDGMLRHTFAGDASAPGATLYELYRLAETSDGQILVFAASDVEFAGFCRAIDRPELADDPRFKTLPDRLRNAAAMMSMQEEELRKRPSRVLLERLVAEGVPCGPVHELEQVLADPQIAANGAIVESVHPHAGPMRQPRPPARFDRTPAVAGSPAPLLGEHSDAILAELGYGESERAELRRGGTVN